MHPQPGPYFGENARNQGSSLNSRGNEMNPGSSSNIGGHPTHPGSVSNLGGYAPNQASSSNVGENSINQVRGSNVAGSSMNQVSGSNEGDHIIYIKGKRIDLSKRPTLEGTTLYVGYAAEKLPKDNTLKNVTRYVIPHDDIVFYGFVPIEIWLTEDNRTVGFAHFTGCYLPIMAYYKHHNFLTRWVRLKGERDTMYDMVVYVGHEGRLIGVRPTKLAKGRGSIQVTPYKWLIVHRVYHYEVSVDPMENRLTGIKLETGNKERAANANTLIVDVGNIKFMLYSNPGNMGNPSGAVLVENQVISIGEKFDPTGLPELDKPKRGRPKTSYREVTTGSRPRGRPRKNPVNEGQSS